MSDLDGFLAATRELVETLNAETLASDEKLALMRDGISLLDLKNRALLSYINNLLLVVAGQLKEAGTAEKGADEVEDDSEDSEESDGGISGEALRLQGVRGAVTQRVVLEKGVRGLEAKISYQVDRALRAHRKHEEDLARRAEAAAGASDSDASGAASDASDAESDSDDPTQYRPFLGQMRNVAEEGTASKPAAGVPDVSDDSDSDGAAKKYRAPRIAATTPFARERHGRRRDATMEEYIRDAGDAPAAEPSIGSTIMDHGRGGERTERERRKQQEIDDYEERNFTRIQQTSAKQARRDAHQRQRDASSRSFFGEDWQFLDGDRGDRGDRGGSGRGGRGGVRNGGGGAKRNKFAKSSGGGKPKRRKH